MKNDLKHIRSFFNLFRPHWFSYTLSTLMVACRNLLITYFTAYISSHILSQITEGRFHIWDELLLLLTVLMAFILFDTIGTYAQATVYHRITNRIREHLFTHAIHLELRSMDHLGDRSELLSRINRDTDTAASMLNCFLWPLMCLISGVGATAILLTHHPKLCALLYIFGFIALGLQSILARHLRCLSKTIQEETTSALALFLQSLSRTAAIRMSNATEYIFNLFTLRMGCFLRLSRRSSHLSGLSGGIQSLLELLSSLGVILYSLITRELTLAEMVLLSQMAPLICQMILSLSSAIVGMNQSLVGIDRIQELLELPVESSTGTPLSLNTTAPLITADSLQCTWPDGTQALTDVSFSIPSSQLVAIHGPSGSGKTTLLRLLLKLYPYTNGSLQLLGQEVSGLSTASIRNQIAYVSQKNSIFPGTIRENLLLGTAAFISDEEIFETLKVCEAYDWVMAYGLDTPLTEGGTNLSGGQRHMLALARAILSQKKILLLDEATAGVDMVRTVKILQNLKQQSFSMVIVSHEQQVLDQCDYLIRL